MTIQNRPTANNEWLVVSTTPLVVQFGDERGASNRFSYLGFRCLKSNSINSYRAYRGGSWNFVAAYCRAAYRNDRGFPGGRGSFLGFRCARRNR